MCRPPQAPHRHRNGASVHPAPDRQAAACCLHRPARCRRVHRAGGTIRPDRQGLPRDGHHPGREGRPAAALTWTERGLGIETSYDLRAKHRELLTVLDRHDEAIQNEWSHFTQVPAICSYQTLMELVPETARATWYDRAIEAAVQSGASLSALLPLLVDTEETARLACVTGQCTDDHLSRTGYRTVDHGGVPGGELWERVRELPARGWSPKEIARALKVPPETVTPLIRRLGAAEPQEKEAPLTGCWVNQGWSSSVRFTGHPEWPDTGPGETGESGLVIVVVARERGSSVRVCEFLVDTWCLGVKNALGPKPVERRKLPSFCADAFRSYPGAPVEVPLVLAQRIVFGAVGYARGLGFEPHADFAKAAGHLGEWDGVL